jgi:hypothetical protein
MGAGAHVFAQQESLSLDRAITVSLQNLISQIHLDPDSTVVVLGFTAPTQELSDYLIDESTLRIVNSGAIKIADRRNLALLQQELNFQLSGEVDDETIQDIGKKLGAQSIISGSFVPLGTVYRLRVQAIQVETARIQGAQTATVQMDSTLAALLHIQYEIPDFSTGRRIGAGFLNPLLGLGSFTMGDWLGGTLNAAGYALAAGLIIWDVVGFTYDDKYAGVPGSVGFGLAGATALFGFIRPFFFHKSTQKNKLAALPGDINITLLPDSTGIKSVRMIYSYHY